MIRPRESDEYATQSARPSQNTHADVGNFISLSERKLTDTQQPFASFATTQSYSPDPHVQADDMPSAQTVVPTHHEWQMRCMHCPCKLVLKFSPYIFMTDLLPKPMYSKKHPRYSDGCSMTICPICLFRLAKGADTYERAAEVFDGFALDETSLAPFEAVTTFGEKIPLIKSEFKVLHYNSVAAMDLMKQQDATASFIIY